MRPADQDLDASALEDTVPYHQLQRRPDGRYRAGRVLCDIAGASPRAPVTRYTLETASRAAALGFRDLPVEFVMDLGGGAPLTAGEAACVQSAVQALLDNIRRHAAARSVVIHADVDPATGDWELTIRDDGCGFDTATTPWGCGRWGEVRQALRGHQVATFVCSEPGDGTAVVLQSAHIRRPSRLPAAAISGGGQSDPHGDW